MPKFYSKLFGLLVGFLLLSFSNVVLAQEQFATEYDVTYEIQPNGEVLVTQDISIINLENDVVATNYAITIDGADIYEVIAEDSEGDLEPETVTENGITKVSVTFNEQVIGKDRSLDWKLEYKTRDLASKVGEVWNINIPRVEVLDSTKSYNVSLILPKSFGPKIYISPDPVEETEDETSYIFIFDKDRLQQNGVTASFGSHQVLNFQLKYKLENQGRFGVYKDIALPPNIQRVQKVKLTEITPPPEKMYSDADGNLMATFRIPSESVLDISANGSVKILSSQINPELGGSIKDIPQQLVNDYTGQERFWETRDREMRRLAGELTNAGLTTSQNAKNIYDFVTSRLTYNFSASTADPVERHGALKALTESGTWACTEFTDLFIALARASGIPARELNGYALVKDPNSTPLSLNIGSGDVLHSWAEFFDPNFGWVQVDPTWGSTSGIDYFTKLDTNHFVFVVKGLDSEYPYPAGAYKLDGTEKQVEVDIAQNPDQIDFQENITVYKADSLFHNLFGKARYIVYNSGGITLYNVDRSGKFLVPFSTMVVVLPEGENQLYFEGTNGESLILDFVPQKGKPPISGRAFSSAAIILSVFAAILLCSLIYSSIMRPNLRKRLTPRQHPRRQDQDQ